MKELCVLAPGQDMIAEVVRRLPDGGKDFSTDLVVFPGKRPAQWLRKRLAERVGGSFIPPKIFSIETFIEYLHDTVLRISAQRLSTLDAVAILLDVHREQSRRLGQDAYDSLEAFLPVGIRLVNELEEVMLADLSERRIRDALSGVQFQKFHSLAAYYRAFYDAVAKGGYVTRATMYRTVADNMKEVDWAEYRTILLAGFHTFTQTEKRIVSHLRDQENVVLLFQNGVGVQQGLQSLGLSLDEEPPAGEEPVYEFVKAPDLHGQVFALAARLEQQLQSEKTLDQRTAIVLPSSEALFPTLHFALSLLPEESYNIALQYPLSRTPVYGFLHSLMDVVSSGLNGRHSAAAYLKFVLHPYTKNIRLGQSAEVTRIFFHTLEEHFVRHYAKTLVQLEELEGDDVLFGSVERRLAGAGHTVTKDELRAHLVAIHDHTVRRCTSFRTVRELATRAMEVLEYIVVHSTAGLHPYFRPYVQRMMEVLDGVRSSLLARYELTDVQTSFSFLRKCLVAESIPFPGTPLKGLQLLGLLETRNLKFDTLYILDATDDILPGKPAQDMLLPQPMRAKLGLETSRDAERLSEYYFTLAVRSAKRVVIMYAESNEREKSRFVQKLLWQLQQREGVLDAGVYEEQVKYRVQLANERPQPIAKSERTVEQLRNMPFSANALDMYLACPLKFYYRYVLQLAEREEITDDLEASDVGELVHAILKEYFEPMVGTPLSPQEMNRTRLEQVVDAQVERAFGKETTGVVHALRRQVMNQLSLVLDRHQKPLVAREKVTLLGVEQRVHVEYKGYQFTGRIDRIEKRGERVYIVDYKTGADEKPLMIKLDKLDSGDPDTWRVAIPTFQLVLYMLLYSRATGEKLSSLEPVYLMLGKNSVDENIEHRMSTGDVPAGELFAAVEPLIMRIIHVIHDTKIPFFPTPELEKHCPACSFRVLCGTQWVRGWSAIT